MSEANHGTYTKDGITRTASSAAEAVAFEFDGWKRVDAPKSK